MFQRIRELDEYLKILYPDQGDMSQFPRNRDPMTLTHWRQKDGTQTKVTEMDDQHLDNTIKMICRLIERDENHSPDTRVKARRLLWIERLQHEQATRALEGRIVPPKPVANLVGRGPLIQPDNPDD